MSTQQIRLSKVPDILLLSIMRPFFKSNLLFALLFCLFITPCLGQDSFTPAVEPYVKMTDPLVALTHAKVIDGTGGAIKTNQTLIFKDGIITQMGDASSISIPEGAKEIDCTGKTLIPGLVMLHEHLFYPKSFDGTFSIAQMTWSFPRLYLAGGVTTMRTAGSIEPQTDLNIRDWIKEGRMLGPKMDVTSPFIERPGTPVPELGTIKSSSEAEAMVNYWAEKGVTSFKVYQHVTKEDLQKVVAAAHARNLKVTGHICSVTYREAAEIGIDNIEHGFFQASDFVGDKTENFCPVFKRANSLLRLPQDSPEMKSLMEYLIAQDVTITSTLPVFEPFTDREIVQGGGLDAMSPEIREKLEAQHTRYQGRDDRSVASFKQQMAWEKTFYEMGGKLVVGTDPTGAGRTIAGYGNQRLIELLIEADFSLTTAIKLSSLEGARYLEQENEIGSLEVGKRADIVLIDGDLEADIRNIRKMEIIFKDGIGFDSPAIFKSMKGKVGMH